MCFNDASKMFQQMTKTDKVFVIGALRVKKCHFYNLSS